MNLFFAADYFWESLGAVMLFVNILMNGEKDNLYSLRMAAVALFCLRNIEKNVIPPPPNQRRSFQLELDNWRGWSKRPLSNYLCQTS